MIELDWHGSRPMICVAVTYVIKAGQEGRAVELFRELTGPTRGEPGCRMYLVHRSTTDPRKFFLYEQYDDEAGFQEHATSPHMARIIAGQVWPLVADRRRELYNLMAG